jgi:hypothetical protein
MIYAEQPFSLLSFPLHAISDVTLSYGIENQQTMLGEQMLYEGGVVTASLPG